MAGRISVKGEPVQVKQEPMDPESEQPPGVEPEPNLKRTGGGEGERAERTERPKRRRGERAPPPQPPSSQPLPPPPQPQPLPFEMVVVKEEPPPAADEDTLATTGRGAADASSLVECLYTGGESSSTERTTPPVAGPSAASPDAGQPPRPRNQFFVVQGRENAATGNSMVFAQGDEGDRDGRRRPVFAHELPLDGRHAFFNIRPQIFSTNEERPLLFHAGFPGERPPFVPVQRPLFPHGGVFETRPPFTTVNGTRPFLPFLDGRARVLQGERPLLLSGQGERIPLQCERPPIHRTLTRGDQGGRVLLHRELPERNSAHNERSAQTDNLLAGHVARTNNGESDRTDRGGRPSPQGGRASPSGARSERAGVQRETSSMRRERSPFLHGESSAVQRERTSFVHGELTSVRRQSGETSTVQPQISFLHGERPLFHGDSKELKDFSVRCTPRSEFDIFGEHIASQLQQLPLHTAVELQRDIQNLITEARLGALKNSETRPVAVDTVAAPTSEATSNRTTPASVAPTTATTTATTPTTASTSASNPPTNDPYGRIQVHFHVGP